MKPKLHPANLLVTLVSLLSQRLRKPAMFATIGAIGCLVGAIVGELLAHAPTKRAAESSAPPTELCLLIDCSGSMSGGKLQEVVRAAASFARRQDLSRNPMSVVAFSTTAQPITGLTSSAADIDRALAQLEPGGNTSMDLGLAAAGTGLQRSVLNRQSHSAQAILLFTDGEPTEGPVHASNASLDVRERTRRAAQSLRSAGTTIVAVGTGDANAGYLAELTGDRALVFFASQGGFDTAFRQAEKAVYRRQLIDSSGKSYSLAATLLRNTGWCLLISLGLAFLLWGGQNAYLHRAPYTKRGCVTVVQGSALAGVAAGLVAQAGLSLFGQTSTSILLQHATFVLAWGILGALLGRGISAVVPNLKWQTALAAGAIGGLTAGAAFLASAVLLGDFAGRLAGAIILGAAIGYSIALAEEIVRTGSLIVRWGPRETTTLNLGSAPVTIGGGDDHVCLRGLQPLAFSVWMDGARIFCKDHKSGKQVELKDKGTFTVARVEFQVALKQSDRASVRNP